MWRRLCKSWNALSHNCNAVRTTSLLLWCGLHCGLLLPAAERVDFAHDVQPILHTRCGGCHGSHKPQGGLSVLTLDALLKGGAVIPGASAQSPLIVRVTASEYTHAARQAAAQRF
jgi:hypothetical protein